MERDALVRFPHSFSGGQRPRIAIARALVIEPEFVLCDEPMSALDVTPQAKIQELLLEQPDRLGLTILIITHNLAAASQFCDRILAMQHGQIVEDGGTARVFQAPRSEYTARLIGAVPRLRPEKAPA